LTATLVVAHHEDSDGLKQAAKAVATAAKDSDAAASFLMYKPVAGTLPEGLDEKLKFVWIREDSGDANAPVLTEAHGASTAMDLVNGAREGLNDFGSGKLEPTRSGGTPARTPKYLMAIGFTFDPAKADVIKEAADAFDEANEAAGTPISYTVHKTDSEGGRLILIHADSIDESMRQPLITKHFGAEKAQELKGKLEDAVKVAYALPLTLVPQASNP